MASNRQAREKAERDRGAFRFEGLDLPITWDDKHVMIQDNESLADRLAEFLGTDAKHSTARHENSYWQTFSIVRLP